MIIFPQGDSTSWIYKLYTITVFHIDTMPIYHIENLAENYNEAILKKTELTMTENEKVLKHIRL